MVKAVSWSCLHNYSSSNDYHIRVYYFLDAPYNIISCFIASLETTEFYDVIDADRTKIGKFILKYPKFVPEPYGDTGLVYAYPRNGEHYEVNIYDYGGDITFDLFDIEVDEKFAGKCVEYLNANKIKKRCDEIYENNIKRLKNEMDATKDDASELFSKRTNKTPGENENRNFCLATKLIKEKKYDEALDCLNENLSAKINSYRGRSSHLASKCYSLKNDKFNTIKHIMETFIFYGEVFPFMIEDYFLNIIDDPEFVAELRSVLEKNKLTLCNGYDEGPEYIKKYGLQHLIVVNP